MLRSRAEIEVWKMAGEGSPALALSKLKAIKDACLRVPIHLSLGGRLSQWVGKTLTFE